MLNGTAPAPRGSTAAIRRRAVLAASLAALAVPAVAQEAWPARAARIIVPFAPGGTTDIPARIIADHLARRLGKPFVVENRSGAKGTMIRAARAGQAS